MVAKILQSIFNKIYIMKPKEYREWENAQEHEISFWKEVGETGYSGYTPDGFVQEKQRNFMLAALDYLEKPIDYWIDKTVVELGSGPAGIVEYITAKRRIAVEPLIGKYREVFPHLSGSTVEYIESPAESAWQIPDRIADLVVCFNVLDHTIDPEKVFNQISRICKPGGYLLFQVNMYLNEDELKHKVGLHADLHPHSFFLEDVTRLIESSGFTIWKQFLAPEMYETGEHYFMCAGQKMEPS